MIKTFHIVRQSLLEKMCERLISVDYGLFYVKSQSTTSLLIFFSLFIGYKISEIIIIFFYETLHFDYKLVQL
jgi:hypothetical protein